VISEAWDRERVARELLSEREKLQRQLTGEVAAARGLSRWVLEDILAAAITHVVMDHPRPIHNRAELERTLWAACAYRVHRAHEGRFDLVRGRFERTGLEELEEMPDATTPEGVAFARQTLAHALDFAAMLTPLERRVHAAKYMERGRVRGYSQIARAIGEKIGAVRSAERSINFKMERFAAIVSAGRLCDFQAPAIASLAAGEATDEQATAAHVHLRGCAVCRTHYKRHLRYLRTPRFHDHVNQLLPPVVVTNDRRTGVRDLVADWAARLFSHDAPATATQLATGGAGRGIGTAAALKLASLCIGAGALGVCAATGVVPWSVPHHAAQAKVATRTPTPTATPIATRTPKPVEPSHRVVVATPTPKPKPHVSTKKRTVAKTQGGTSPTSHEAPIISPARSGSAPNGASEFNPTAQTGPASPAPVSRAPGANEFQ
jgi:hypothetical protein